MKKRVRTHQRDLWALSAVLAPAAMDLTGYGWRWIVLGGAAASLVIGWLGALERRRGSWICSARSSIPGQLALLLTLLWTVAATARAMELTDRVFAGTPDRHLVAAAVLLLATEAALAEGKAAEQIAAVVAQLLGIGLLVMALASVRSIRWSWCGGLGEPRQSFSAFGILLLPAALYGLPKQEKTLSAWVGPAAAGLAASLALAVAGLISPQLAATEDDPMMLAARSLGLHGILERMEPIWSVTLLMSAFCTVMLLARITKELLRIGEPKKEKTAMWGSAAASYGLYCLLDGVPESVWLAGATIFWGLIPIVTQYAGCGRNWKKDLKKRKNNA